MILNYYKGVSLGLATAKRGGKNKQQPKSYLEDISCSGCSGRSRVRCPNRKCRGGKVRITERYTTYTGVGAIRTKVNGSRTVKVNCKTCGGKDHVDCKHCALGIDPVLLQRITKARRKKRR